MASLIGEVVTGAMIGLFIRVVQDSLQTAWILGVSPGRYEGKTYPLNPDRVTVGKSELNDISLYLTSELDMQNGAFVYEKGKWIWQGDAAEINSCPQTKAMLNPGDIIQLGGTQFRFETRSTASEVAPVNTAQVPPPQTIQVPPPQVIRPIPQPSTAANRSIWILMGQENKIQLPAAPAQVQLGRSNQNQICINDPSVSSQHAIMDIKVNSLGITDLNSTNGTHINGQRIPSGITTSLHENDRLLLGQQEYIVRFI